MTGLIIRSVRIKEDCYEYKNTQPGRKEIVAVTEELKDVHGTQTEVYARIVGYYRSVRNWNKGKLGKTSAMEY